MDLHHFRDLVRRAGETAENSVRAEMLGPALALWRGRPLAGLAGAWMDRTRDAWTTELVEATLAWAEAGQALGRAADTVATLRSLLARRPLVEPLTGALMRALAATDRGAEALAVYEHTRGRLATELGTDPGPALQALHLELLRGWTQAPLPAPASLPPDVAGFSGRAVELAQLDALLAGSEPTRPVVISALSGMAGLGKTALAVHWAHRVAASPWPSSWTCSRCR